MNDGTAAPTEGCSPLVGFPAGAIALVDRGNCNFTVKTFNAQAAGAVAVVIVNNVPGAPTAPGGTAPGIDDPDGSGRPGRTAPRSRPGCPRAAACSARRRSSNASRVVLTSRAWGHEGGNDIKAQFVNPGAANSPLSVSALGNEIMVSLATNASGALSSTAADVVAAINAHPAAQRARQGADVPEQHRHRRRPGDAEAEPVRLPRRLARPFRRAGSRTTTATSSGGRSSRR